MTSSEVEPDTKPLQLQTFADVQAFLLFEDELDKESDKEEVIAAGEDMDEDPQVAEEVRTLSPKQDQPEPSHVQESTSDSSSPNLKKFDDILPLTERQLIKYLRKMLRVLFKYYDENVAHRDQTDKLVETTMSTIDRNNMAIKYLYQGLNVITKLLKDINNAVNDDLAINKKINEAIETFARISTNTTKSSTNMAWNLGSRMTAIKISQTALKTPSSSVTPTLGLTDIPTNVEGKMQPTLPLKNLLITLERIFKKKAKNKQSRARNGKDKVKSKSKVNQVKKIQLKGLKLPSLKMCYKKTRAEIGN
ncbi:hypothetical protein Tco_0806862 [Tanacetum coccineum]